MAYDKAVIFNCLKKLNNHKETIKYRFNNCDWGWLVEENELEKFIDLGETEYKKELSPVEVLIRFENNYHLFEEEKKNKYQTYKNLYEKYNEKQTIEIYKNFVQDYEQFEGLIYDKRVINITFHKYWWESGMN